MKYKKESYLDATEQNRVSDMKELIKSIKKKVTGLFISSLLFLQNISRIDKTII